MKLRKLMALLLAISMMFTACLLMSCNDDDDDDDDDEVPEEDLSPAFDGDIKSYKGNFKVLTREDGTATSSFNCVDLVADNNLGDAAIIKVVRERNQRIEDNFGVKITRVKSGVGTNAAPEPFTTAQNAVLTESNTYGAFIIPMRNQVTLACGGGMLDLSSAPYMDITGAWWDQGFSETMQLAGGVYFIAGDCNTVDKDATYCTLFNEHLLEVTNKGQTAQTLYKLVKDGDGTTGGFTMEQLNYLARTHSAPNTDGGNLWDPAYANDGGNYYGLYTQSEMTEVILQAGGWSTTKVDSKSVSGLKANLTAEFESAVNEVKNQFGAYAEDTWFCNLDQYQSASNTFWDTHARGTFKSNRATFFMCHVGTIDNIRDMTSDYGVLPIGKLYDSQTEYGNTVQYYNCFVYSIPSGSDFNNEKASYILEAMAYYSSQEYAADQSLNYTYYYRVLRAKGVRDENAWAMLDLIFDNRKFDLIACANIGGIYGSIRNASVSAASQLFSASQFSNLDEIINKQLEKLTGKAK